MSATLDADIFVDYFKEAAAAGMQVSRIDIPGLAFPVTEYFLEDIIKVTGYTPEKLERDKQESGGGGGRGGFRGGRGGGRGGFRGGRGGGRRGDDDERWMLRGEEIRESLGPSYGPDVVEALVKMEEEEEQNSDRLGDEADSTCCVKTDGVYQAQVRSVRRLL
jgi:HrpA-like RNA helicase